MPRWPRRAATCWRRSARTPRCAARRKRPWIWRRCASRRPGPAPPPCSACSATKPPPAARRRTWTAGCSRWWPAPTPGCSCTSMPPATTMRATRMRPRKRSAGRRCRSCAWVMWRCWWAPRWRRPRAMRCARRRTACCRITAARRAAGAAAARQGGRVRGAVRVVARVGQQRPRPARRRRWRAAPRQAWPRDEAAWRAGPFDAAVAAVADGAVQPSCVRLTRGGGHHAACSRPRSSL